MSWFQQAMKVKILQFQQLWRKKRVSEDGQQNRSLKDKTCGLGAASLVGSGVCETGLCHAWEEDLARLTEAGDLC